MANAVRRSSLDLPGGSVKTEGGEILLRTKGQAYRGREFEDLVLLTRPDGTHLRLGDVATVVDGFADTDQVARFDGKPAVLVQVFRVGDQDALEIAEAGQGLRRGGAAAHARGHRADAPGRTRPGSCESRLDLLIRNGRIGFILVFAVLALFLRFRLAFWVSLGIPISFLGAFWLMPILDVSINLISLFAFILVLGIVVDDAIVVGENIYTHQQRHGQGLRGRDRGRAGGVRPGGLRGADHGRRLLAAAHRAGTMGKIMRVIPLIVIPCLLFSLVESLWILPAHLSHYKRERDRGERPRAHRRLAPVPGAGVAGGLQTFDRAASTRPSSSWPCAGATSPSPSAWPRCCSPSGWWRGGFVRFIFFPDVEADYVSAALTMPQGTPVEVTAEAVRAARSARAEQVRREIAEDDRARSRFSTSSPPIGEQPYARASGRTPAGRQTRDVRLEPGRGHHRAAARRGARRSAARSSPSAGAS